jgi:flagellar P-ring protein precursor FlgI
MDPLMHVGKHRLPTPIERRRLGPAALVAATGARLWLGCILASLWLVPLGSASAQVDLRLRDICRLQGQEENTLQGLGMVVGLRGTGDNKFQSTSRALARTLQLMGAPIGSQLDGSPNIDELGGSNNVALVFVTVTIPATGALQGDRLDCRLNAIAAKSLEGGTLMLTPLLGPRPDNPMVYALAQGPIVLEDPRFPTSGRIAAGCKMEASVRNEYLADDVITLSLDPDQSSFEVAQYVEDIINESHRSLLVATAPDLAAVDRLGDELNDIAEAIDQMHVRVRIPSSYRQRPVQFVSVLLDLPVANLPSRKRVVIHQREGVLIVGDDVQIAPVAIAHKNLSIAAVPARGNGFVELATAGNPQQRARLKDLVEALNTLAVPTDDTIAIIKALKRQGNLFGELILE